MARLVFDIETDGFLHECTRMWVLCAKNLDTGEKMHWLEGDMGWQDALSNASLLVGHNILGFDLLALEKLFNFRVPKNCKVHDTFLMSAILDYRRFGNKGHSLATWGESLGLPKIDFEDFSQYSEDMLTYCERDVDLNAEVYKTLVDELKVKALKAPKLSQYLRVEHAAAKWIGAASLYGWPFDVEAAKRLKEVLKKEMEDAHVALSEKLGYKVIAVDKKGHEYPTKKPKWTKQGCYSAITANWFGVDTYAGFEGEERPIVGEYSRIEIVPLSLTSVADVKLFLGRNGWVPTTWNTKIDPDTRKLIKTSPKITEDSLEFLGGDGALYTRFAATSSRAAILDGWLAATDSAGNLHGDCMLIGTPSMRARHSIIVNVPSGDSLWGPEMRALFIADPGWVLIGCDSASNQARGLAHYLKNPEFTDTLINGDIHQYNATTLTHVLKKMGVTYEVKRSQAKRILYAFLFGASGSKLWSYIFGNMDEVKGRKLKNGFLKAVPGFSSLIELLGKVYSSTQKFGDGYIVSLAGNRIYVDSYHKLLVYLLQSAEKITCSAAVMLTAERLEAEGIPYKPCIYYHDEIDFQVPAEYAERAAEIGKQAFVDGPKLFDVNIMDGNAKIGKDWLEIH